MRNLFWLVLLAAATTPLATHAQGCLDPASGDQLTMLARTHDYIQHRSSSYDRSGRNADARTIDPGATLTLLDEPGPGVLTHIWFTIASSDERHLKQLVLRIYWDGESTPAHGWTNDWSSNGNPKVNDRPNLSGEDNYVWLEARGQGHFVGVSMSILQNQDDWWGEGDDMFFIDGESRPSINGTGSEDYFLGAWGFGSHSFGYGLYGAPVKGSEHAGSRTSVYRFHLDSPIPFTKSLLATIEHGHANHRSGNFFSVAYWYQSEPHASFPALPPVNDRIPRLFPAGGPGNSSALPK